MTNNTKLIALAAGIMALSAISPTHGNAGGGKLTPGNTTKLKVKSVQIGITPPSGDDCPATATMGIWIKTNKAGPVTFMVARKGQNVSAPMTINAVKGSGGVYMATYMKNMTIASSIDAQYRALVADGKGTVSNWSRIQFSC